MREMERERERVCVFERVRKINTYIHIYMRESERERDSSKMNNRETYIKDVLKRIKIRKRERERDRETEGNEGKEREKGTEVRE